MRLVFYACLPVSRNQRKNSFSQRKNSYFEPLHIIFLLISGFAANLNQLVTGAKLFCILTFLSAAFFYLLPFLTSCRNYLQGPFDRNFVKLVFPQRSRQHFPCDNNSSYLLSLTRVNVLKIQNMFDRMKLSRGLTNIAIKNVELNSFIGLHLYTKVAKLSSWSLPCKNAHNIWKFS